MPQDGQGDGDNPQNWGDLCPVGFKRCGLFLERGMPAWGDQMSWRSHLGKQIFSEQAWHKSNWDICIQETPLSPLRFGNGDFSGGCDGLKIKEYFPHFLATTHVSKIWMWPLGKGGEPPKMIEMYFPYSLPDYRFTVWFREKEIL